MDCSYVSHTASRLNPLRQDSRFVWLIGDGLDTTIGDETHCTYDRFVLGGTQLQHSVTPDSVHVFRFDEEWHIPKDQAKLISDHYPIEFAIQGKHHTQS
ncbi:hypothetical protein CHS0354_034678 [Potamilus streckersoni]|uniref:Uncharacterized protein n=1 Tax=Potamilus streckersoni TaxID=2493646 RepID=A0AAE0TBZ1_9BIVA|nr:hypothetical protein CHS0354_034678 [Potamilus streckersoni]